VTKYSTRIPIFAIKDFISMNKMVKGATDENTVRNSNNFQV
jgi:hypothetical protein